MSWKIVRGPHQFRSTAQAHDMDVGWRYQLVRNEHERSIRVIVAGGRLASPSLPDECKRAIRTKGRSAIQAVLDRDEPPEMIIVTTAGLREQPPPDVPSPEVGTIVACAGCGRRLPEPSDLPAERRPPCPSCGSKARTFEARATLSINLEISSSGEVQPVAPPEPAEAATADMLEAGYKVVWYCYPDGLYLVQVFDDATGDLLDAGGGDDPVDALLEIASRLLPPRPDQ